MRIVTLIAISTLALTSCTTNNTPAPGKVNSPATNHTTNTGTIPPTETIPTVTVKGDQKTVTTPSFGSGKTTLEIFADFQCPACISFNEGVQPILEEYASQGKLKIVYRQYPLTNIHKNAMRDSIAALCSQEQGKYMTYKKELYAMEKQKSGATVTDGERIAIAKNTGMDTDTFGKCLANNSYVDQVQADIAYGDSKNITGTPTMLLDGVKLDMSLFRDVAGFRTFLDSKITQ